MLNSAVPEAGDRAPDAQVTEAGGGTTSLFAQIYNPDGWTWNWSLLAFDGRQSDSVPSLLAALSEVNEYDWIRPRLILASPVTSTITAQHVARVSDLDGYAHAAYALNETPALILIRPGGHIAFRGSAQHPDRLKEYCAKTFAPGNAS